VPYLASTPPDTEAPVPGLLSPAVARTPEGSKGKAKGQAPSTACARKGTRSETDDLETDDLSSGGTTANPSSGETTANPSSVIRGPAGIRVALRHRPPLTQAPCLGRGTRNPPRRVLARNPSRRTRAKNLFHLMLREESPPRRGLEGRMRLPTPHRQPASNFVRAGSLTRSVPRVVVRSKGRAKG
jgi:hypothetical protein